jgi:hypothetical protein
MHQHRVEYIRSIYYINKLFVDFHSSRGRTDSLTKPIGSIRYLYHLYLTVNQSEYMKAKSSQRFKTTPRAQNN